MNEEHEEHDYTEMTPEEFDDLLAEVIDQNPASSLLAVPGVYEVLSEHFNNKVLDLYDQKKGRT